MKVYVFGEFLKRARIRQEIKCRCFMMVGDFSGHFTSQPRVAKLGLGLQSRRMEDAERMLNPVDLRLALTYWCLGLLRVL